MNDLSQVARYLTRFVYRASIVRQLYPLARNRIQLRIVPFCYCYSLYDLEVLHTNGRVLNWFKLPNMHYEIMLSMEQYCSVFLFIPSFIRTVGSFQATYSNISVTIGLSTMVHTEHNFVRTAYFAPKELWWNRPERMAFAFCNHQYIPVNCSYIVMCWIHMYL
jgi:hypothetical protein